MPMCPLPCLTRSLWSSQTPLSHPTLSSSSPEVTALLNFFFMLTHTHTSLCRWWLQPWNSKTLAPWKKSYDKLRQHIKKQRHYFANKGPGSQSYGFSSSHVWVMFGCESWTIKKAKSQRTCFWTVALEKTLESPLEIKPVNPKGQQSWIFIGKADAEAEAPILCLPDAKNQLIRKDPDAGKDWRQKEKRLAEHEMVG